MVAERPKPTKKAEPDEEPTSPAPVVFKPTKAEEPLWVAYQAAVKRDPGVLPFRDWAAQFDTGSNGSVEPAVAPAVLPASQDPERALNTAIDVFLATLKAVDGREITEHTAQRIDALAHLLTTAGFRPIAAEPALPSSDAALDEAASIVADVAVEAQSPHQAQFQAQFQAQVEALRRAHGAKSFPNTSKPVERRRPGRPPVSADELAAREADPDRPGSVAYRAAKSERLAARKAQKAASS